MPDHCLEKTSWSKWQFNWQFMLEFYVEEVTVETSSIMSLPHSHVDPKEGVGT